MLITESYRALNRQMHEKVATFGHSGCSHAGKILKLADSIKTEDILDYGCGKGSLQAALPFKIKQYDPCVEEYSSSPEPSDFVVCTDVMEHIEPDCLSAVMDDLKRVAKNLIYFVISAEKASKNLPDGRNAHLIVESVQWWMNLLWSRFDIKIYQDLDDGTFEVLAKNKWKDKTL